MSLSGLEATEIRSVLLQFSLFHSLLRQISALPTGKLIVPNKTHCTQSQWLCWDLQTLDPQIWQTLYCRISDFICRFQVDFSSSYIVGRYCYQSATQVSMLCLFSSLWCVLGHPGDMDCCVCVVYKLWHSPLLRYMDSLLPQSAGNFSALFIYPVAARQRWSYLIT